MPIKLVLLPTVHGINKGNNFSENKFTIYLYNQY